ncbi:MAG: DUF1488 family protein [Leptospirales bacterium]
MEFPKPDEWYDFDRNLACFWELDEKTRVWWEIRGDTLDDQFHGDNNDKPEVFRADKQAIEDIARRNILLPTPQSAQTITMSTGHPGPVHYSNVDYLSVRRTEDAVPLALLARCTNPSFVFR